MRLIKEYFDELLKTQPSLFMNEYTTVACPKEMETSNGDMDWQYVKSSVSKQQISDLEEKYGIEFPDIYKEFISTYAHLIGDLSGVLDNFLFEDDVEVTLQIPTQAYNSELDKIEELFDSNREFVGWGYIPIGQFDQDGNAHIEETDETGLIWLDINSGEVIWLDEEEAVDCSCREDVEENRIVVFESFTDLLDCFFKKEVYECPEEE